MATFDDYIDRMHNVGDLEYWGWLEESGWLNHVPTAFQDVMRSRIIEAFEVEPEFAFYALAFTSFDAACIYGAGPEEDFSYAAVLRQLAEFSFGRFAPEAIEDSVDFEGKLGRVAFRLAGARYQSEFEQDDNWFAAEVHDLINEALEGAGSAYRMFILPPCDQIAHVVFMPPDVYQKAEELGALPTEDEMDVFFDMSEE